MAKGSAWTHERNESNRKEREKDGRVDKAFHEVFHNVPSTVKATGKKGAAKRKMMVAVALSKARQAGAKIPEK